MSIFNYSHIFTEMSSAAAAATSDQIVFNDDSSCYEHEDTTIDKEMRKCDIEMIQQLQQQNKKLQQDKKTLQVMVLQERSKHQQTKIAMTVVKADGAKLDKSRRELIISLRREIKDVKENEMNLEMKLESKIKKLQSQLDSVFSIDLTSNVSDVSDVVSTPPPKNRVINEVTPVVSQKRKHRDDNVSNNPKKNMNKKNKKKKKRRSKRRR